MSGRGENPWDASRLTKRLIALHDGGLSFGDIAKQLSTEFGIGFSKNACVGKAHRLGLPARGRKVPASTPRKPPASTKRKPVSPRPDAGRVPLLKLELRECRFPVSDPPNALFCGLPQQPGLPFCAKHCAVA